MLPCYSKMARFCYIYDWVKLHCINCIQFHHITGLWCLDNNLLSTFASLFISDIGLWFYFQDIFVWFCNQWCWPQSSFKNIPSSAIFWNNLRRIHVNSLNIHRIHLWSHSVLDFCLLGSFYYWFKFLLVVGLFIFCFFLIQSWETVHV